MIGRRQRKMRCSYSAREGSAISGTAFFDIRHKILGVICAAAVALASSGCVGEEQQGNSQAQESGRAQEDRQAQGNGELQEGSQAQENASGTVPVARIEDFGRSLPLDPQIRGGVLYYMDGMWDQDSGWYRDTIVYKQRTGEDAEEVFALEEGEEFLKYLAGTDGSVYCIYAENPGRRWDMSIRKIDSAGNTVYDVHVFDEEGERAPTAGEREMLDSFGAAAGGAVDGAGRLCLCSLEGRLILFREDGTYRCAGSLGWDARERSGRGWGIAGTGEGVYAYLCDSGTLRLKEISMEDGRMGDETAAEAGGSSLEVYSGDGIFVSDADALWRYDASGGRLKRLLGWGDGEVNLNGYYIDAAGDAGDGGLYLLAHLTYEDVALVRVDYGEAPLEETPIVLGTDSDVGMRDWKEITDRYNRTKPARRVEVRGYGSTLEFQLAIAGGEEPDLIDLRFLDTDTLAEGGVLENLEPFLEGSGTVGKEDLLASVLEAGMSEGEYVAVIPGYSVSAFLVERGTTDLGRWTPEEFLAQAQAHPESLLVCDGAPVYYRDNVMQYAVWCDMEAYVDWEGRECFFDSERFLSLLEGVSSLEMPDAGGDYLTSEGRWDAFTGGELLAMPIGVMPSGNWPALRNNGGLADGTYEVAGYPNQAGELRFLLNPAYMLGICSGSQAKEDAWDFLEFLLSKEFQDSQEYLYARADSFDKWVSEGKVRGRDSALSKEDREYARYMADNAYRATTKWRTVLPIVIEEMNAACRGERTAQEAAHIIQSRITLMLW